MAERNNTGKEGESEARAYLEKLGYQILHTNWHFHHYLVVWLPQYFQCTLLCGYLYLEHFYIYILVGGL